MDASNLNRFVSAYITAALWSSTNEGEDKERFGEFMDESFGFGDVHPLALRHIEAECLMFVRLNQADIGKRYAEAGHDFWMTRNGHGVGFWDGDWPEDVGERLSDSAQAFGERSLYVGDDGFIYQDQWNDFPFIPCWVLRQHPAARDFARKFVETLDYACLNALSDWLEERGEEWGAKKVRDFIPPIHAGVIP